MQFLLPLRRPLLLVLSLLSACGAAESAPGGFAVADNVTASTAAHPWPSSSATSARRFRTPRPVRRRAVAQPTVTPTAASSTSVRLGCRLFTST